MSRKPKTANPPSSPEQITEPPRTSAFVDRFDWLMAVALAIATVVVFSTTWSYDLTNWDDGAYITNNRNLHDIAGLRRIWFSKENEQYYPLTFTTYWLEFQLWGERPTGYHVVSTILHALNVLLVVPLGRRMGLSTLLAAGVAGLFAVHPMQAMTVAWVAEQKTQLACLFLLMATMSWIAYRRHGKRISYSATVVFFTLALLSKTSVLLAPLAWLVLDVAAFNRPIRRSLLAILPMLGLAAAAAIVTSRFEAGFIDAQALTMIPTPLHRVLFAGTALWWYVLALVIPVRLSPVYPLWNIETTQLKWWLALLGLAFAVAAVGLWRTRLSAVTRFGFAWFLMTLLPTLGLVAYGNLAVTPVSNHYVYIPCIGMFIALASLLDQWRGQSKTRGRMTTIALCCILISSIVAVRSEARAFESSKSLWTAALARDPDCFAAHLGLGQEALGERDLSAALLHFSAATRIRPRQYEGHAALGDIYIRLQDWPQARSSIDTALNLRPDHVPALLARATLAEHDADMSTALEFARRANALDPGHPRAAVQLGVLLLRVVNQERAMTPSSSDSSDSRLAEARSAFDRVMRLRPDDEAGYRGAVECDRLRRDWASAIATARAGLSRAPDSVPLKNLLSITLARCPDDRYRDGPAAVRLAEEIAPMLGGANFQLHETLASAYAAAGRYAEAASVSREAARLAREAGNDAAARANEQWAVQYDEHRPRLD